MVNWYEYAGQRAAWRTFWQSLTPYLPLEQPVQFEDGAPSTLRPDSDLDLIWVCGGDLALHPERFVPLVVPVFQSAPTRPGIYCSLVVQQKASHSHPPTALRLGINGPESVSGHFALAHWWQDQGYGSPKSAQVTGGHEVSVQRLLAGEVDLIALDSQGWGLLVRAYPNLTAQAEVIAQTQILPAPPLCLPVAKADQSEVWRAGFARAAAALRDQSLNDQNLGLIDFVPVQAADYAELGQILTAQLANGPFLTPLRQT